MPTAIFIICPNHHVLVLFITVNIKMHTICDTAVLIFPLKNLLNGAGVYQCPGEIQSLRRLQTMLAQEITLVSFMCEKPF
jgi:hypothetical protein